jgi:hypothetical protein
MRDPNRIKNSGSQGAYLFFKNRAPGYYDESFLHDAEGTEFTIGNGAVEFEPECQNDL